MKQKSSAPPGIGHIGCGNISNACFEHTKPFSDLVKIVAGTCGRRDPR